MRKWICKHFGHKIFLWELYAPWEGDGYWKTICMRCKEELRRDRSMI